ncbi:SO2930 family diheme c-type cytochrome [Pseudomonas nitroreducens]|uniref:SO2930 family diheme c-type cytochrome n=1 Tax=Pseudomonas nitroreducens TaxID=46680 RepID=UPI0018749DA3|nr:SO2930 family diheme c-type cytochrome [Pseudomonas nitritireducens]
MTKPAPFLLSLALAAALAGALAGCGQESTPRYQPEGDDYPEKLSGWGMLHLADGHLTPAAEVLPYDLNTPLFTDYAHKLRTVWMPEGLSAQYAEDRFDYPVGTVLTKTFYYPRDAQGNLLQNSQDDRDPKAGLDMGKVHLVETRVLVRQKDGWAALPYVWNADQSEATLELAGDSPALELTAEDGKKTAFTYMVPDANQCSECHAEQKGGGIAPLGPKARHLNKDFAYAEGSDNQLQHWQARGFLKGLPALAQVPQNALWGHPRPGEGLEKQARSYLDANCSHCHNPKGAARTSGLHLDPHTPVSIAYGLCKPPVAAGGGTGGRLEDIHPGSPEKSVLSYRVGSDKPGDMMPELGRTLVHREGLELLNRWIASLPGDC